MKVATELSQEIDRGFGGKYIYRRWLEGLVVARIISFTWYIRSMQKYLEYLCVGVLLPLCRFWGAIGEVFVGIFLSQKVQMKRPIT